MKENLIRDKSFAFALNAIGLYKQLLAINEFVLSKQFFRSATSIGANVEEATAGVSRKEFIYRMSISSREARETLYWIKLIEAGNFVEYEFMPMKRDVDELIKILTSIVKTTQAKT
jgi:four helix bundle protein